MQFFDKGLVWFTIVVSAALTILAVGFIAVVVISRREIMKARQRFAGDENTWKQKYESLFESSLVGMIRLSLHDWTIQQMNQAFALIAKRIPFDIGGNFLARLPQLDQENLKAQLYDKGYVRGFETSVRCSDGATVRLSFSGKVHFQEGSVEGIVEDTTPRIEAEEKLREQTAFVENAHDAIIVLSLDNVVKSWNRGAERLFLWPNSQALGRPVTDLIYREQEIPVFKKRREELLRNGEWSGELSHVRRDGSEVVSASRWTLILDSQGKPISILETHTDITERKLLEAKFLRMQRLESLGLLAGGIAHDLNNILAPIILSIQSLKKKWDDAESREYIGTLETSVRKGADLVKEVMTFARGVEGQRAPLKLEKLIKEVTKTASYTFPQTIVIESAIAADLWPAVGDASQIQQVLMNVSTNAKDAMPNGGRLSFSGENVVLDEKFVSKHPEGSPGVYVLIQITDTGRGIPSAELDKIFEPFYTTKSQGQGTGLGLPTALGIVKSHQGFILVDSRPGEGTTFKIYLPAQLYPSPGERTSSSSSQKN